MKMERQMPIHPAPRPVTNSSALDVAAEANHRIADNLSMIAGLVRMQGSSIRKNARGTSVDEVRLILEEIGERLEAVARLHLLLAGGQQEASIEIASYLREIAEGVVSSLSILGKIELQFASDRGFFVRPETALSLGLIVSELVTNAVKYAHPTGVDGKIRVACHRRSNGNMMIEISDDGVGLPEDFDPMKNEHLGFRLMRSLADKLGATVTFHVDGLGLCFALQMPAG
jgi:two-component sensor histidine kinase